ncbi:MAG TPA: CBS domain-containing protein [Thermodesulfobacteriota bacterium]|nr:CBS domain-containing protein [Thermodesulfobacteriota bacterium]
MLVKECMTKDPVTCSPDEDVRVVFGRLTDMKIRQAPVLEGGKLIGIVTDRDLRMAVVETVSGQGLTVRSVMTPKPVTVAEDSQLREAAGLLSKNKFNALPVLSAAGELAGVLTTTDVLNGLVRALDAEKK